MSIIDIRGELSVEEMLAVIRTIGYLPGPIISLKSYLFIDEIKAALSIMLSSIIKHRQLASIPGMNMSMDETIQHISENLSAEYLRSQLAQRCYRSA